MQRSISLALFFIALIASFNLTVTVQEEVPAVGHYEGIAASVQLDLNAANAETYHECVAKGCSANDCSAATQNGYTCKSWKCFKSCLRGKGFTKGCYDYLPDQTKFEACKTAGDDCESKCKY
tara:strand:- start:33 stop:398 length:366 start_codon:yes stop_codon:yes gene_type:complete